MSWIYTPAEKELGKCRSYKNTRLAAEHRHKELRSEQFVKRLTGYILALSVIIVLLSGIGCSTQHSGPKELLDKYFTSAQKQDYATTYTCYYQEYRKKVPQQEFVNRRKDASVVQTYKILELTTQANTGKALVQITFAPSAKMNRSEPQTVKIQEDLIKEGDEWKIKVW